MRSSLLELFRGQEPTRETITSSRPRTILRMGWARVGACHREESAENFLTAVRFQRIIL